MPLPPPYEFDMENLIKSLELQAEIEDLKNLGLTEEDIEGYLCFFVENWIKTDFNKLN